MNVLCSLICSADCTEQNLTIVNEFKSFFSYICLILSVISICIKTLSTIKQIRVIYQKISSSIFCDKKKIRQKMFIHCVPVLFCILGYFILQWWRLTITTNVSWLLYINCSIYFDFTLRCFLYTHEVLNMKVSIQSICTLDSSVWFFIRFFKKIYIILLNLSNIFID